MTLKLSALPAALAAMLLITIGTGQTAAQTTFTDIVDDAYSRIDITDVFVDHDLQVLVINFGDILINWEITESTSPMIPSSSEYAECVITIKDIIEVIIQDLDDSANLNVQPSVGQMPSDGVVEIPLSLFDGVDEVEISLFASYNYTETSGSGTGYSYVDWDNAPDNGFYTYSIQTTTTNEPPEITYLAVSPEVIWPPNNKERTISLVAEAWDPDVDDVLEYFYSIADEYGEYTCADQPLTGGIRLMASRRGYDKDGRTYTITVTVVDPDGESDSMDVTVLVPHDKGKK